MKKLPFKNSKAATIGLELEFQIVDPITFDLISRAKDLIKNISTSQYQEKIKPEITQSMLEINSSIHQTPNSLFEEILEMHAFLLEQAKKVNIYFSGGGTHPFQLWNLQKIFPTKRFKDISKQYRYISKCSTVFGQHVHIGCPSADDALYLTHALAYYVPHLIAISASSPFFQGVDTGYHSSRSSVVSAFPSSGVIPFLTNWDDFSAYFYKMRKLRIVKTMKDFYWDIRPKPEFGTVEIRVCDTPLTISKAIIITAYIQALAQYILSESPFAINQDLYYLHTYNRFQASRYGFDGIFINPYTLNQDFIINDILNTLTLIEKYAENFDSAQYLSLLKTEVINKQNDAAHLRQILSEVKTLPKLVHEQCLIWSRG